MHCREIRDNNVPMGLDGPQDHQLIVTKIA